jgi:hypothetical protein
VGQLYYLTGHEDIGDSSYNVYHTETPSPENLLYCFDNPALDLINNFDSASVGDYAYEETDFTYTLTVTIGSAPPSKCTMHVGVTTLAKRVSNDTGTVAGDWQGVENIISSSNVPNCQITFDKVHNIVGYLPFPSLQISIPTSINTPTGH